MYILFQFENLLPCQCTLKENDRSIILTVITCSTLDNAMLLISIQKLKENTQKVA